MSVSMIITFHHPIDADGLLGRFEESFRYPQGVGQIRQAIVVASKEKNRILEAAKISRPQANKRVAQLRYAGECFEETNYMCDRCLKRVPQSAWTSQRCPKC